MARWFMIQSETTTCFPSQVDAHDFIITVFNFKFQFNRLDEEDSHNVKGNKSDIVETNITEPDHSPSSSASPSHQKLFQNSERNFREVEKISSMRNQISSGSFAALNKFGLNYLGLPVQQQAPFVDNSSFFNGVFPQQGYSPLTDTYYSALLRQVYAQYLAKQHGHPLVNNCLPNILPYGNYISQ